MSGPCAIDIAVHDRLSDDGAGESSPAPDGSAQIELLTQVHDLLIEIVNSRVGQIGTFTAYCPQLDRLQCDMLCAAVGAIIEATPNGRIEARR